MPFKQRYQKSLNRIIAALALVVGAAIPATVEA
jgi:hypothetical protein